MTDQQAIQILVESGWGEVAVELGLSNGFQQALTTNFGPPLPGSEADLARAALDLLAQDPAPSASFMSQHPPASGQTYPLTTIEPQAIALTTAALLALQTRVKFKHDSTGKWTFEIEKKSSGDGVMKEVVQRLLALLPK